MSEARFSAFCYNVCTKVAGWPAFYCAHSHTAILIFFSTQTRAARRQIQSSNSLLLPIDKKKDTREKKKSHVTCGTFCLLGDGTKRECCFKLFCSEIFDISNVLEIA
jgi:hypothetical protein